MKSPTIVSGLCALALSALLTGCHCADSFSASTEATLVSGDNEFDVVFGDGSGTAQIYVQLDGCTGDSGGTIGDREFEIDPNTCVSSSIWAFDFENSIVPMHIRTSDAFATVVRVISPGTDDLDDCSELAVGAVRVLD